jgi:hypothetical protein
MYMPYDDEDDEFFAFRKFKQPKYIVRSPLAGIAMDDLLDAPAHVLASRIRTAALDGRQLVIGDPACLDDAAVRIPDSEITMYDYAPHLEWSKQVDHPQPLETSSRVNRTLANRAIPFRVFEPALPDRTKITATESVQNDAAVSVLDRCIVKGYSALQAVAKSGENPESLRHVLNLAWGGSEVFKPNFTVDFLGDISFHRYLARSGKRRFQLYRNVGWVEIVSAGSNQARTENYGINASINWQRRAELATAYVHMALMLEGHVVEKGMSFSIAVRVPDYSVQYNTWAECNLKANPEDLMPQSVSQTVVQYAMTLSEMKLDEFIYTINSSMLHSNPELRGEAELMGMVDQYERLVFFDTTIVHKYVRAEKRKSELAFGLPDHKAVEYRLQFKSHEPATAVIEALTTSIRDDHSITLPATDVTTYLETIMSYAKYAGSHQKLAYTVSQYLYKWNHVFRDMITAFAREPAKQMLQKIEYLTAHEIPREYRITDDHAAALRYLTAYFLVTNPHHKAAVTLAHWASELRANLRTGIRSRKQILYDDTGQMSVAVTQDIVTTAKIVYNHRYRTRGHAHEAMSKNTAKGARAMTFAIISAFWFWLADISQSVSISGKDGKYVVEYQEKYVRRAYATLASRLSKITGKDTIMVKELQLGELHASLQKMMPDEGEILELPPFKRDIIGWFGTKMSRFVEELNKDLEPDEEAPAPQPTIESTDIGPVLKKIMSEGAKVSKATVEEGVAHILRVSGGAGWLDDETVDRIISHFKWVLEDDPAQINPWVRSKTIITDPEVADKILEQWLDAIDIAEMEEKGERELA